MFTARAEREPFGLNPTDPSEKLPMTLPSEALLRHGSDKITAHSYGPVYDTLFGPNRPQPTALLEIGVFEGASLRAWAETFPAALVYGVDVNPPAKPVGDRCRICRADAADPADLARAMWELGIGPLGLDAVIDDGSHTLRDQLAAWAVMWDFVRPGGLYVIEDIQPGTPHAVFARIGGAVYDFRPVRGRSDDVVAVFHKKY